MVWRNIQKSRIDYYLLQHPLENSKPTRLNKAIPSQSALSLSTPLDQCSQLQSDRKYRRVSERQLSIISYMALSSASTDYVKSSPTNCPVNLVGFTAWGPSRPRLP
eukprot:scaffold100912_cov30-Prasinocladus_malaysianus.AAC.1